MDYAEYAKQLNTVSPNSGGTMAASPVAEAEGGGSWFSPTMLGLGAGAAALAGGLLLRKPLVSGEAGAWATKAIQSLKDKLPKEYPLLRQLPESPVVSLTEKHSVDYAGSLEKALSGPLKTLMHDQPTPQEVIDVEDKMYRTWKALGETPAARASAMELLPPKMKQAMSYLESEVRPAEQRAAQYLGERELPEIAYPYLPRVAKKDFDSAVQAGVHTPGLRSDIRSTLGMFEKEREFPTMKSGVMAGEEYLDPSLALLYRVHSGHKLIHTAHYIKSLEDAGVLFRDKAAAQAASKLGDAVKLEGVPGAGGWFARSKLEAQFLADQLANPRTGSLANLVQQSNQWLRNPNLMNPLPHFTKNMMFKYGWSGGNLGQVVNDIKEYTSKANPELLSRFQAVMPFHQGGKTSTDLLLDAKAAIEGSTVGKLKKILTTPNEWSSKLVFGKFDPWLRYSRWKQYVGKGMSDQEAANNTWIDLIRYGTRSDLVDFWKSVPLNFFVPWRVGTVTSAIKNLQQAPERVALFLGGVDLLREAMYRKTGWWFHTPIDYIEAPISKIVEGFHKKPSQGASEIGSIAGTTALFGPGGEGAERLIGNVMQGLQKGSLDYKQLTSMLWGLASVFDPYGNLAGEVTKFATDGKPSHLVNVLQSVAFGAHNALNYRPRRFGALIPESLIGKSEKVAAAEALQAQGELRRELQQPRKTIRERVGED